MINNLNSYKAPFPVLSKNKSLSQKEIIKMLIKTIQLYKMHKITLDSVVKVAKTAERTSSPVLPQRLNNIISEIRSFSTINDILNDILSELIESEKNL